MLHGTFAWTTIVTGRWHAGCLFENAGGSQLPDCVIDAVRDYMLSSYVQLGATTPMSLKATATVALARKLANTFVGGEGRGECYLGASATACISALREAYTAVLQPGDVVVVEEAGHEANIGVWLSSSSSSQSSSSSASQSSSAS